MKSKDIRVEIYNWIREEGWKITGDQWDILKSKFKDYEDERLKEFRLLCAEKDKALIERNEAISRLSSGYNKAKKVIEKEQPKTMFTIPKDLSKYR